MGGPRMDGGRPNGASAFAPFLSGEVESDGFAPLVVFNVHGQLLGYVLVLKRRRRSRAGWKLP